MDVRYGPYSVGSGWELLGSSEHGNQPSASVKVWEFHVRLSDCQLLKEDRAPWSQ
jgi:hypothetical protein